METVQQSGPGFLGVWPERWARAVHHWLTVENRYVALDRASCQNARRDEEEEDEVDIWQKQFEHTMYVEGLTDPEEIEDATREFYAGSRPRRVARDPYWEMRVELGEYKDQVRARLQARQDLVTSMIEAARPLITWAAKYCLEHPRERAKFFSDYRTWRRVVLEIWMPAEPVNDWNPFAEPHPSDPIRRALLDEVEGTSEFRALRKLDDQQRKATPEYRAQQRAYERSEPRRATDAARKRRQRAAATPEQRAAEAARKRAARAAKRAGH